VHAPDGADGRRSAAADAHTLDRLRPKGIANGCRYDSSEGAMDQLMISIVVTFFFLARFAVEVLAVVVALWIWNRWPALATLARRTSP
jgi:hypothetical protein